MIETYNFRGSLDLDSSDAEIGRGYHRMANNGLFRGNQGSMSFESAPGTNLIPNSQLPGTGTNNTIGCRYDAVSQRLFFFNWNSTGFHGIYIYYTQTGLFQTLIQTGSNTTGDPLGFLASGRISSIDIIYQDNNLGDLLFYVDSLGRPTKINIQRYLANTYNPIKRDFIEVIKAPPRMVPRVTYENDPTVSVNNCLNSLFKFRSRPVYDDNEKSVYSAASIVPLPNVNSLTSSANTDPTQNCRIAIYVPTGDVNVKKIEIWVQQTVDKKTNDWLLVVSLDKGLLAIPSNDVYRYVYYNNAQYTSGIISEINQLQDYVPPFTNCQGLMNGDVIGYGGIKEGFNQTQINATVSVSNTLKDPVNPVNGVLFFASQGGQDSYGTGNNITLYLTGTGSNNGNNNPTTIPVVGGALSFVVDCATSTGTSKKFVFNNFGNSQVVSGILGALQTAAVAQGFTFVSSADNSITLSFPGIVLYYAQVFNVIGDLGLQQAYFSYATKCAYQFAICYFDAYGRTIGAALPASGGINTAEDLTGLFSPQVTMTISSRPPLYASYYSIVRSSNLTYNRRLFWVSNQTFTNLDLSSNNRYAYIGISNMLDYNDNIDTTGTPTDNAVVSYTFTPGDRIRFLIRYPPGTSQSVLSTTYDYEITAESFDPSLSGVTQKGQFIKILYPTNDINANFDFNGDAFQNYKILIYNYVKQPTDKQNTVFYEFSKMFAIGNPGTSNAYHIGSDQTQSSDLSRTAIITSLDGDLFFRQRLVPAGGIYYINAAQTSFSNQYATINTNNDQSLIDNPRYQISQQQAFGSGVLATQYPQYSDNKQIYWNKTGTAVQIRLKGTYTLYGDKALAHNMIVKINTNATTTNIYWLVKNFQITQGSSVAGGTYTVSYDEFLPIPAGAKAWIIAENQSSAGVSNIFIGAHTFRLDALNNIQIPIIESSFSDKYNIVTNSNLRPVIYDPNAGQFYYSTLFRYGQAAELGTNINNSNKFFAENFDEFQKEHGDIIRMRSRQKELRIFQKRRCGRVGIYQKFVKNNEGSNQLIVSDTIITPNNIQYFEGEWGIGNQPDSLCSSGYADYFADPIKGYWCRLSLDGVEPISELYKVQTWAGINFPNYLNRYNNQFGGNSVILGVYNFLKDRDGEAIFVLQAGSTNAISFQGPSGTTITQPAIFGNPGPATLVGQALAFNEHDNAFTSFYPFAPDSIVCCENLLFSFYNGQMYSHNNAGNYGNFYGVQYPVSMTVIYKEPILLKKTFLSITEVANFIWECPVVYTNLLSYGTTQQQSNLVTEDFQALTADYHASFWNDMNSQNGLIDGDVLKGNLISVTLSIADPPNLVYLNEVSIEFIPSAMTNK